MYHSKVLEMTKPVIAHFVRGFLRPTETFIINQITSLQNYEVKIFCHHLIDNSLAVNLQPNIILDILPPFLRSVEKYSYSISRHLSPLSINRIIKEIELAKPKILHFHYLVDARFFLPITKKLKLPSIVSGYGWDVSLFPQQKLGYGRYYLKPIFDEIDLFLAMSEDMKKDLINIGCPENKIIIHYYGSDTNRFKYSERNYNKVGKINILFCSTLVSKKAPQLVLFALKNIENKNKRIPDWNLTFIGDGPLKDELQKLVNIYRWEDRVFFKGHIPYNDARLVEEYKNADIFIQPSITANGEKEGIPGTLIEAMSSGLPVVSTYHAGIPYVIQSGLNGLLVEENNVESLGNAILELMNNNELRCKLGKSASIKAQDELDLKAKTRELEKIYSDLLERK